MKQVILSTILFFLYSCANDEDSSLKGVFKTSYVTKSFYLYKKQPALSTYKAYIERHGALSNNSVDALELASYIAYASLEFGIDPDIMFALIRKESAYNQKAISPTNAAGLTQFTSTAIREVHDQLGLRGTDHARKSATDYWKGKIPKIYKDMTGNEWLEPESHWTSTFTKEKLKNDPARSVIYGVILLKTYLSWKKTDHDPHSMKELYRIALEQYNGDPPVKAGYAKKILEWSENLH